MRIAVSAPYYVPAIRAGGPVPGVQGVVRTLAGHNVWVFAGDRDLGDVEPYPAPHKGTTYVDGTKVSYLPPLRSKSLRQWVRALRAMRTADVLYANSCFSAQFTILPLLVLRLVGYTGTVVISPRGELAHSALRLGQARMKRAWLWIMRRMRLYRAVGGQDNVIWLASSELEAANIQHCFTSPRVVVSGESLRSWDGPLARPVPPGSRPLQVVSVARVTPVKGTVELVRAAARVRQPLQLNLIGLLENREYVDRVRSEIAKCPNHVQIKMDGPKPPEAVREALLSADLFVSLTHGENFGHAIGEALQMGVPTLISDQTPWSFIEEAGAGTVLTSDQCRQPQVVAGALDRFAEEDLHTRETRSTAAVECANRFDNDSGHTTLLDFLADPTRRN